MISGTLDQGLSWGRTNSDPDHLLPNLQTTKKAPNQKLKIKTWKHRSQRSLASQHLLNVNVGIGHLWISITQHRTTRRQAKCRSPTEKTNAVLIQRQRNPKLTKTQEKNLKCRFLTDFETQEVFWFLAMNEKITGSMAPQSPCYKFQYSKATINLHAEFLFTALLWLRFLTKFNKDNSD